MASVELADVYVLQHSRDRRKHRPAERSLDEQLLSVGAIYCVTPHPNQPPTGRASRGPPNSNQNR